MTSPAERPVRGRSDRSRWLAVETGWECASGATDEPPQDGWIPARVPGGVAEALRAAGAPCGDLDAVDWWFRTTLDAPPPGAAEELVLHLEGVTPYSDVLVEGAVVAQVASMHVPTVVPLPGPCVVHLRCRALGPVLSAPYRPRARWRTRVAPAGLRHVRTTLLGRAPGFAPGPPVVGPWRPVRVERRSGVAVERLLLQPSLDGSTGVLAVHAGLRGIAGSVVTAVEAVLSGESGEHRVALHADADGWRGELHVPEVARWWPHTHGRPVLHDVELRVSTADDRIVVGAGQTGFRALLPGPTPDADVELDGLQTRVNGVPVFVRGAVWTRPAGPTAPTELRTLLEVVRDAGMNAVRLPGTGVYETDEFHDLCDELGLLVWQDLMLANHDAPESDPVWRALLLEEVSLLLDRLVGRPSTAVLCGGSEVEQQAAMTGLAVAEVRGQLVGTTLPGLLAARGSDVVWVPSSPCGGDMPFRNSVGIAHYFGLGGYRRPLSDVRLAGVRFASECLALANLQTDGRPAGVVLDDPEWLAGVPRDVGADWDFADVRDHYLALLYGVDPAGLRAADPDRYLALSQAVSGELAAELMGEWRRTGSPCGGGLLLWLADQQPGPGWGLLDVTGRPKPVMAALRRALAPVAVWTTDEGLDGVDVHVANDGPVPLSAVLRLSLHRDDGTRVDGAERPVELPAHGSLTVGAEDLLGRFADASRAYRFGPAEHDAVAVALSGPDGDLSTAVRWTSGRPSGRCSLAASGLTAVVRADGLVEVRTGVLAHGVRVRVGAVPAADDLFDLVPGQVRLVRVPGAAGEVHVGALNVHGELVVTGSRDRAPQ